MKITRDQEAAMELGVVMGALIMGRVRLGHVYAVRAKSCSWGDEMDGPLPSRMGFKIAFKRLRSA